jgi:hypothetical protein
LACITGLDGCCAHLAIKPDSRFVGVVDGNDSWRRCNAGVGNNKKASGHQKKMSATHGRLLLLGSRKMLQSLDRLNCLLSRAELTDHLLGGNQILDRD